MTDKKNPNNNTGRDTTRPSNQGSRQINEGGRGEAYQKWVGTNPPPKPTGGSDKKET